MICYLLLMGAVFAEPAEPGLYAEFNTSMGSFTALLEYEKAPRTVANFVTLAEGTREWMDLQRSFIRTEPFYNGITFHRVINGFMNQTGSPNGRGNDGPGYRFADEFHPDLRHDRPGILSMANSGADSNGSQFFITVGPTSHLDDKHTVFGHITAGMPVVSNINQVATDHNDRPITPVVINHIEILREGESAETFDPSSYNLPTVGHTRSALTRDAGNYFVTWEQEPNRGYWVLASLDLVQDASWSIYAAGIGSQVGFTHLTTNAAFPAVFFSVTDYSLDAP